MKLKYVSQYVNYTLDEFIKLLNLKGVGGGLTDVTYTQLIALIKDKKLKAAQKYRITDFQTVHYIVDTANVNHGINTGVIEPLIVTAISTSAIAKEVTSELHPEDIIHYDPIAENWLEDESFCSTSGSIASLVTGFKGVITFRHDTIQDVSMQYDFRNVKFRRWLHNIPTWSAGTYAKDVYVIYNNSLYKSLKDNNTTDPSSSTGMWAYALWFGDLRSQYFVTDTSNSIFPAKADTHVDVLTFYETGNSDGSYKVNVKGVHFAQAKSNRKSINKYYIKTSLLNNVFILQDSGWCSINSVSFPMQTLGNTFTGSITETTITGHFVKNITGDEFYNNNIGIAYNNIFGYRFSYNNIGIAENSYFGSSFSSNTIGESSDSVFDEYCGSNNVGRIASCRIGDHFSMNIGASLRGSTLASYFQYNNFIDINNLTTGSQFNRNTITGSQFGGDYSDVATYPIFYNYHSSKTIYQYDWNLWKIQYLDGTGTMQVKALNGTY